MPSTMTHLLVAREYSPDAEGAFFLGSFIPDFTNDRARKDELHFRDQPDRWPALAQLAHSLNPQDGFSEGWLLHLFTDLRFEETVLGDYIAKTGSDWFLPYRNELRMTTYHLFHEANWTEEVWRRIFAAPTTPPDIDKGPTTEEIIWYRDRVYNKHRENRTEPSTAFPPDVMDAFARETAALYRDWRPLHQSAKST